MTIPLGPASPRASRDRPGRPAWKPACAAPSRAPAPSPLLGLAPGGVCRARRCRRRGALLPHPFTLTRRASRSRPRRAVCSLWHSPWGRPRRALPGTVFPWSPDFPPPPQGRERSSGRLSTASVVARPVRTASRQPRAAGPWSHRRARRRTRPAATAAGRRAGPRAAARPRGTGIADRTSGAAAAAGSGT